MEIIADFHTHSKYSRGCSRNMDLENLYRFSKIKGINIIGTGDFTHPQWFTEIQEKLKPAEEGLFQLKDKPAKIIDKTLPSTIRNNKVRFILSAEISTIFSKNNKTRKVHSLILAPNLKSVAKINNQLNKIGNLKSDGRPILGLNCKELLKIVLKSNPENLYIPAHIWTPWFSLFGSKSGFNSLEEAFEELTPQVKIIETGLSSDPFMNLRIKELQNLTIISNSDAHSPLKLGREANILTTDYSYSKISQALTTNNPQMKGTIEFYPEEGKYHFDGHRKCNLCLNPKQTKKYNNICPKCHKPLVLGVSYRVQELADFPSDYIPKKHKSVEYIIPLLEILKEIQGLKTIGKKVLKEYYNLIAMFGDEFSILRKIKPDKIKQAGFKQLALALQKMRKKEIIIKPGYDGVFGIVKIFKSKNIIAK